MATLGQAVNRIEEAIDILQNMRDNLSQIHGDTSSIRTSIEEIQILVSSIDEGNRSGFINLSLGINELISVEHFIAEASRYALEQNDTMICILEKISKNTCSIHDEAHKHSVMLEKITASVQVLEQLAQSVHCEDYLEIVRRRELETKIEECCPPDTPSPACVYEPCAAPSDPPRNIPEQTHTPLPRPMPVG